jgi:hypothetical protein
MLPIENPIERGRATGMKKNDSIRRYAVPPASFAEAETTARAHLPSEEAAANVTYLRQMLAQQNTLETAGRVRQAAGAGPRQLIGEERNAAARPEPRASHVP